LLLVAFLLVNTSNYHHSLVLASVVQGDAVNCNRLYVCAGGVDIENLIKIPMALVFHIFIWGGLVLCLRG